MDVQNFVVRVCLLFNEIQKHNPEILFLGFANEPKCEDEKYSFALSNYLDRLSEKKIPNMGGDSMEECAVPIHVDNMKKFYDRMLEITQSDPLLVKINLQLLSRLALGDENALSESPRKPSLIL